MSVGSKLSALALSALALTGVGVVAGTGEAFAASNTQLVLIDDLPTDVRGAWVKSSDGRSQVWAGLGRPNAQGDQTGVVNVPWSGTLVIDWIKNDSGGSFFRQTHCDVQGPRNCWSYTN